MNELTAAKPIEHLSSAKRKLLDALLNGRAQTQSSSSSQVILRRDPGEPIPLSLAQEQIWLLSETTQATVPFYNESICIYRRGPLDRMVLERSFTEIIRRHEAWRTTFELVDGQPTAVVHAAPQVFPITVQDLRSTPAAQREEAALRLAREQAQKPFQLNMFPLLRLTLIHLQDDEYRLYVTMHQIIVDGLSVFKVLPMELATLYESFSRGGPSPLPELPIQYGDFACWQKKHVGEKILEEQLKYWEHQLSGELPVLSWPDDFPHPARRSFRGAIFPTVWPKQLAERLNAICQQESVTLFMVLLAGFASLLHRYTGQEDIIVGTLSPAGRERRELETILGYFLNPVPLRFNVSGGPSFHELLRQSREAISGAIANDDVPFHRIVQRIAPRPDSSRNPIFDSVISLAPKLPDLPTGWSQTFMDIESGGSRWGLYIELNERPEGLMIRAQYNPDLFEAATIRRMVKDFEMTLAITCAAPAQRVSELPRILAQPSLASELKKV